MSVASTGPLLLFQIKKNSFGRKNTPKKLSSRDLRASTLTAARDSVRGRDVIVVWRFCDVTLTTDDDGDSDAGDDKQDEADAHRQQDCQRNHVTVTANQSTNTIIVNSLFLADSR